MKNKSIRLAALDGLRGIAILFFGLAMSLILVLAFKTPFSLLTYTYPHESKSLFFLINGKKEVMVTSGNSIKREFVAKENNLGTISTNIKSIKNIDKQDSVLLIKLSDSNKKFISESRFDINTMVENNFYSFGFPLQTDSKNKKYIIEYKIEPENSLDGIIVSEKENNFVSVYFLNKNSLIKNPKLFGWWFLNKIREPFLSPLFWLYFCFVLPLILGLSMKIKKSEE